MTNAILEEKLFFAQASLTAATRNNEQQELEHKNLWQQLQQSLRDQERLERALKDSRQRNTSHRDREGDSIRDRDSGFGPVSQAGGDEFNRLTERLVQVTSFSLDAPSSISPLYSYYSAFLPAPSLRSTSFFPSSIHSSFSGTALYFTVLHFIALQCFSLNPHYSSLYLHHEQAETRAVQMSTISAKSFAQSARTIAYLEGECGRLKTMLDHFRLVNDKMMCDIRIAREEGMNQKCLEHRLKLTVENEGVLQGRDYMET
jgi:hypothetical protein